MVESNYFKDSIGGSEIYSNPYDTRFSNLETLKQQRAEAYRKDQLENSSQKMEREIWQRFLEGNSDPEVDRLMLAAKLGKYALLALLAPPYLFFYGFPKWLKVNVLPHLKQVNRSMAGPLKNALSNLQQLFKQLGEKAQALSVPIRTLAERFGDGLQSITSPFAWLSKALLSQTQRLFEQLRKAQEFASSLTKAPKALSDQIQKTLRNAFQGLREMLQRTDQALVNELQRPIKLLQSAWSLAASPLKKISDGASQFAKLAKRPFEYLETPLATVQNTLKTFNEGISKLAGRLKRGVESVAKAVRESAEQIGSKVSDIASQAVNPVVQAAVAIPNLFMPVFNPLRDGAVRLGNGLRGFGRQVASKIGKIRDFLGQGFVILKRSFEWARETINKAVSWIVLKLQKTPQFVWNLIKKIMAAILVFFKKIALILQILLVWCRIIARVAFKMMKEAIGS